MTKRMNSFALSAALVALCTQAAWADVWNKKTFVTFQESVETPNGVLPPGKYVFKLADSLSNRHIVQIFNDREDHVEATVLAIPKYRDRPADRSIFTFYEVPVGDPLPIRSWFYPGDNWGQEFAYPKHRAIELAALANQPVPSSAPAFGSRVSPPPPPVTPPAPEPQAQAPVETPPPPPAEEPKELAQARPPEQRPVEEPAPAEKSPEPAPPPSTLPQTASEWPLIVLVALFSLGGAIFVRALAKHVA